MTIEDNCRYITCHNNIEITGEDMFTLGMLKHFKTMSSSDNINKLMSFHVSEYLKRQNVNIITFLAEKYHGYLFTCYSASDCKGKVCQIVQGTHVNNSLKQLHIFLGS